MLYSYKAIIQCQKNIVKRKRTFLFLSQVVLAVAVSCKAQLIIPYTAGMEQRIEGPMGTKGFMYTGWNQNRQEMWMGDGSVVGQFSYMDANGKPVVTYFDAGRQGFRVQSNNLPVAPLPEHPAPLYEAPKPVEDTPEVAEAKRVMAELQLKAGTRTKREADPQWVVKTWPSMTSYNPYYGSIMNPMIMNPILPASPWVVSEKKSRKRREADPMWPTVYSMSPAVMNIQTKHLTPVEARTPADTKQLKMTTFKYQMPMTAMPFPYMNPAILPMTVL